MRAMSSVCIVVVIRAPYVRVCSVLERLTRQLYQGQHFRYTGGVERCRQYG